MFKKTMLLALSAGAIIAFAAPAMAQADELVESGGTVHLAKGAEITATSTNLATVLTPGPVTLTCTKVTVHGKLIKTTNPITIGQTTTEVEGCNATITNPQVAEIVLEGGIGEASGVSFTVDPPGGFPCTLGGMVELTYATNNDILSIPGSTLTGTCGAGDISGNFTLETANGTAIEIS
jgi:hypothetical protein